VKVGRQTKVIFQIAGFGKPIIFLSFVWYLFNVVIHINYGLDFPKGNEIGFGGFQYIESYFMYSLFFTFIPHILCMEKGKHNFLGNKYITDAIIVSVSFAWHFAISNAIL